MTSFRPMAALFALTGMLLPVIGEAADDAASLRAELQVLRDEYSARVDALEARIRQLETTPAAPVEPAPRRRNRSPGARATRLPHSIQRYR